MTDRPTLTTLETSRAQLWEARRILSRSKKLDARAQRDALRLVLKLDRAFQAVTAAFDEANRKTIKAFKGAAE